METWAGHFRHRIQELEEVRAYWPENQVRNALEIGCGNGLAAVYFSNISERITASDLPTVDHQAHSVGLELAKEFIRLMQIRNVDVLGCSAESIPLPDASFDLVYGIYCLEHIPNRPKALKEARRVLSSGGEILLTVPGFAWSLFYPFSYYPDLASRILGRAMKKFFPNPKVTQNKSDSGSSAEQAPKVTGLASFRRHYPNFPFPEPHGSFSSWPEEMQNYRESKWRALLEESGFKNIRVEPINFVPSVIKKILPAMMDRKLENWFKGKPALHSWAQFFCIRATAP